MLTEAPKIIRRTTRTPTILIQVDGNCLKSKTFSSKEINLTNCNVQNRPLSLNLSDSESKTSFQDKIRFFENLGKKTNYASDFTGKKTNYASDFTGKKTNYASDFTEKRPNVFEKLILDNKLVNPTPFVKPKIINEKRTFDFKSLISRWENINK